MNMGVADKIPGATYTTFADLFAYNRTFQVPDYQRAYDWDEKQRVDLLEDIVRLDQLIEAGQDTTHFCGTIICTPPPKAGEPYSVVDGQQRLTTLVLMHARLARATSRKTFLHPDGELRFRPQSMDVNTFESILSDGSLVPTETIAQRNYVQAATEIDVWININKDRVERLLDHLEKRVQFIFFILRDEKEVAKVFETINTRGKPLSQMDLVKNHLMYISAVKRWTLPNVNEVWRKIQKIVGSKYFVDGDTDIVLRAVVTAQFRPGRRKAGETDFSIVAQNLTTHNADRDTFVQFLRFMESGFLTLEEMRLAHSTDPKKPVTRALTFLNHHASLSGVLPLILARQFLRKDGANDVKKAEVLDAIEIANFRLYGLPGTSARTDSYNVTLHTLAHEYFHGRKSDEEVVVELKHTVIRSQKDGISTIARSLSITEDKIDYDFHKWQWLRYFLGRFEEYLLDSQSFDFSRLRLRPGQTGQSNNIWTIEHIWPQNSKNKTVEDHNDREQVRRLGNLMLLPSKVNIQRSNGDLEFKAETSASAQAILLKQNWAAEAAVKQAKKFADYLSQRDNLCFGEVKKRFNKSTIEANWDLVRVKTLCDIREEQMFRFALIAWRFPGETGTGLVFEGVFSLPHEGEAFLPTKELAGIKGNMNYVLRAKDGARVKQSAASQRLAARRKVIGCRLDPTVWN